VPLVLALEKQGGRPVAQAAVFIALSRLEKGLVASRLEEPHAERVRRYFKLTKGGLPQSGSTTSSTRVCGGVWSESSGRARSDIQWLLRFIVTEADRRAIESDLTDSSSSAPYQRMSRLALWLGGGVCSIQCTSSSTASVVSSAQC
jgi:hypothetical protein